MQLINRLFRRDKKVSAIRWLRRGQRALDQGYQELVNLAMGDTAPGEGDETIPTADLGPNMVARDMFKYALEVDPADPVAWSYLGLAQRLLRQHRQALVSFDKALALEPRFGSVWLLKGLTWVSLGNHREAILCLEKAIEIDQANIEAWLSRGQSLKVLGDADGAAACFRQALKLEPEDEVARISLS